MSEDRKDWKQAVQKYLDAVKEPPIPTPPAACPKCSGIYFDILDTTYVGWVNVRPPIEMMKMSRPRLRQFVSVCQMCGHSFALIGDF